MSLERTEGDVRFYSVWHDSFEMRRFPWASSILNRPEPDTSFCPICHRAPPVRFKDVDIQLDIRRGDQWPDVLGCGAAPLFIVSHRAIAVWQSKSIGTFPHHHVRLIPPLPLALANSEAPEYVWLDGSRMLGARLDFEASGFVANSFCATCGLRKDDAAATYERQHSKVWAYTFLPGSWTGAKLFTTDLSHATFFCTEELIVSAREHALTNLRFVPVDYGAGVSHHSVDYLGRTSLRQR